MAAEHDSLRGELGAARESYRRLESCGHPGNFQMGDEHGHFTCVICERDAARAGEARMRKIAEEIVPYVQKRADELHAVADKLPAPIEFRERNRGAGTALHNVANEIGSFFINEISASADSAKWLKERLAEARKDEGRRFHASLTRACEIARTEPQHIDLIGKPGDSFGGALRALVAEAEQRGYERGKAEGEIAGLRRVSALLVGDPGAYAIRTWAEGAIAEIERRQLAARREKAEPALKPEPVRCTCNHPNPGMACMAERHVYDPAESIAREAAAVKEYAEREQAKYWAAALCGKLPYSP